jgi:Mrp family chromosome partitioning ATPase
MEGSAEDEEIPVEESTGDVAPEAAAEALDAVEAPSVEDARPRARLIAFAAGRGGTGRSLLAANVAVYLAQTGKKVVAIDADPAGGSLHLLLGTPRPPRGFG